MKSYLIAGLVLASLSSGLAYAGVPVLKAKESVEINAKAADVWSKMSNFGDLGAWHPAVKSTEIVEGTNNKKGAVRLLTLQDGGTIKEKLEAYSTKKHSYSYAILEGVLPVSSYHSTINVIPEAGGKSKVVWTGNFKRKDTSASPAQGQGDDDAVKTISGVYRGGLDNLKKLSEAN